VQSIHAEHEEYLAEAQRMIDEQTAALFSAVQQAASARWGDQQVAVQRAGRSLTVGSGGIAVEFVVEAITDLPDDADRARVFTTGQARCTVRVAGATVAEWVLHRVDQGSGTPAYAWVHSGTESPVTQDDVISVLRG
jgi:hypothetical protein